MIELLLNKAIDKKYHQSLKYFSHSLKGIKRFEFIKKLAEIDILLASQCIMSSESNFDLEEYLASKALANSEAIEGDKKAKGLLSLIELNKYDLIYSALSKVAKIDREYRYAIKQVINELDRDNITILLEIILQTGTKGLISSLIASVDNRHIEFSIEQKMKIESLFPLMVILYGNDSQRTLKYLKVFNLSKKLIPYNLEKIAENNIKRGSYLFVKEFYNHFDLLFPFSYSEVCEILLTRNKQANVIAFGQCLFDIEDDVTREDLLVRALKAGKYYCAFVLSLIKSSKERHNATLLSPDVLILRRLIRPFTFLEFPNMNQTRLLEIIHETFTNKTNIEGKVVTCKVTGTIPKTIFVEILPSKAKGSIYVKEFSNNWIDDIGKVVKPGDNLSAIIIGIGEKYIQLSVKRLTSNRTIENI